MLRLPFETLPNKIYFFRHGQSIGNAVGLDDISLKDLPNHLFPLTEKGKDEAKQLAKYINETYLFFNVEEIYVSNFLRAKDTLKIVLEESDRYQYLGNKVFHDSRLDEWWKGIFHSMSKEEIKKYYPLETRIRDREKWYHYRPPQGEAGKDVEFRITDFLKELNNNTMISSHGRIGGFMKRILCRDPINHNCDYEAPKNCELWLFEKQNDKYKHSSLFKPE